MFRHHFGETGNMAEAEYFGVVDKPKYVGELKKRLEELRSDPKKGTELLGYYEQLRECLPPYVPKEASFDLIKRCQRSSPTDPEKEYARSLRLEVLRQLSAVQRRELPTESVLFYTACSDAQIKDRHLTTPLDQYHGIDAFLEIDIGGERLARVTIDGSIDPSKMNRTTKSNIVTIWPEDLDARVDPGKFHQFVAREAQKVVSYLANSRVVG